MQLRYAGRSRRVGLSWVFAVLAIAAAGKDVQAGEVSEGGSPFMDFINGDSGPGPLAPYGKKLRDMGITLDFNMFDIFVSNPGMGQKTGQYENVTIFDAGVDLDLDKLADVPGATVRFHYLYVPWTHNSGEFGTYGGDSIVGHGGPYIPNEWHLRQFIWDQKLFNDKLELALGVDQPGNYFGAALCNQPFLCQGMGLQEGASFNPPPYANLSARAAYHFTPEWTGQLGFWRSSTAFPFTSGWGGWKGRVTLPTGVVVDETNNNLYLANLVYQTSPKTDLYPKYYEAMFYHNDGEQSGSLTRETHYGTNGMYLGGRQTVWRASDDPMDTSLSVYGSIYASFDQHNSVGLENEINAGITLTGPFASRPHDSYSLKFISNRLTSDAQSYLKASNLGNYTVGRDEMSIGVDANFVLAGDVIFQPWVNYVWNTNSLKNPVYNGNPKNGIAAGFSVVVLLGKTLGL